MDDVLEVARRRSAALAARNWAEVAAQLHAAFVYVNANGHRLDRRAYLDFLARGPAQWKEQRLEDVQVAAGGATAVLTATVVDDVVYDGEPAQWRFVTTQVYVAEGGEWRYLAGHTAVPA